MTLPTAPSVTGMLPQTATIEREVATPGEYGTDAREWQVQAQAVPCRAAAAGSFNGRKYASSSDFREQRPCYFEPGTDIRPGDRVTVTTLGASVTYRAGSVDPQADGAYVKAYLVPDELADRSA